MTRHHKVDDCTNTNHNGSKHRKHDAASKRRATTVEHKRYRKRLLEKTLQLLFRETHTLTSREKVHSSSILAQRILHTIDLHLSCVRKEERRQQRALACCKLFTLKKRITKFSPIVFFIKQRKSRNLQRTLMVNYYSSSAKLLFLLVRSLPIVTVALLLQLLSAGPVVAAFTAATVVVQVAPPRNTLATTTTSTLLLAHNIKSESSSSNSRFRNNSRRSRRRSVGTTTTTRPPATTTSFTRQYYRSPTSSIISTDTEQHEDGAPLSMDALGGSSFYELTLEPKAKAVLSSAGISATTTTAATTTSSSTLSHALAQLDPSQVEFVAPKPAYSSAVADGAIFYHTAAAANGDGDDVPVTTLLGNGGGSGSTGHYPFAAMMQGSGPYIANHAGKIAVLHIPGEIVENKKACDALLQDIALCWLLDMKLVLVVAARHAVAAAGQPDCIADDDNDDASSSSSSPSCITMEYPHECHNALKVTTRATLRLAEEEAGYLRTEVERKLNRCLRAHGGTAGHDDDRANNGANTAPPEANVVSGNFYTAQRFGVVRGKDYQYTGFCADTHTQNIRQVLDKDDVVLLSTVGLSPMGELVNVNGYHLAATVAASLGASKVIYMANQGCVLRNKSDQTPVQELPLSFAESIASYHQVVCSNMGFATFQKAKEQLLEPAAVELLLHMAWSSWAVSRGAKRAHIVNPSDGALLEELFTANNGANTCLYHDDELVLQQADREHDAVAQKDWDAFFESASAQGQTVAYYA